MADGGVPRPDWTLADWLAYQEGLHPRAIALGLERVRAVAAALGLDRGLAPAVTVAGTNGKGSTSTLLAQVCREAGLRCGLYTSPHLLRYEERVAIDGAPVSAAELCESFAAVEAARGGVALTYFEFGTLAALHRFRVRGVQVQVLEVGLGGRLDAVNLVDADCAIVTSIGLDHTDWLGPDRDSIGFEKAGVFRPGRPAICAERDAPRRLLAHAGAIGAVLLRIGRDFDFSVREGSWDWHDADGSWRDLPLPGLPGMAQLQNAAGAIAAVRALGWPGAGEAAVRAALPQLRLRGRCERHALDLPQGRVELLVDVAHNAEAAAVLAQHLEQNPVAGRTLLVLGMLADKPVEAFCAALAPRIDAAWLADLPPPRGLTAAALAARVPMQWAAQRCSGVAAAFAGARAAAAAGDRIVVSGSFLTAAAVLENLGG